MSRRLRGLCNELDKKTESGAGMSKRPHAGTSGGRVDACIIERPDGSETRIFNDTDDPNNDFLMTGDAMVSFDAGRITQNGLETYIDLDGKPEAIVFTDY